MGEPSNRLLFGFHSIIAASGPPIWNLFGLVECTTVCVKSEVIIIKKCARKAKM